jgi:DNA modification methylase
MVMTNTDVCTVLNNLLSGKVSREREDFYLVHDFHPYFAAFPPIIPRKIIELCSSPNDVVLDNFCGGGTALVEALLLGRNAIGVDINPLACLISKVKTTPLIIDKNFIKRFLLQVRKDISYVKKKGQQSIENYLFEKTSDLNIQVNLPRITNIDYWFQRDVQISLSIILRYIENVKDENLKDFLKVCFSSILRKVSNSTNLECHPCKEEGKKIPDVYEIFSKKLILMCKQMDDFAKLVPKSVSVKIFQADSRELSTLLGEETVDLIVTSPPYGTGSRYIDIYRFSIEWLALQKPPKSKPLETSANFIEDLTACMGQMYQVLKPNKFCFLIFGNPSKRDFLGELIKKAREKIGFKMHGFIDCPIVKKTAKYHKYHRYTSYERILIFQK